MTNCDDTMRSALLTVAFRHRVRAANAEEGRQRIEALLGRTLDEAAFADAIARCLAARLIRDPVRLSEGDLQCHWELELTSAGVEEARPGALPPRAFQSAEAGRSEPSPAPPLDPAKGGRPWNP